MPLHEKKKRGNGAEEQMEKRKALLLLRKKKKEKKNAVHIISYEFNSRKKSLRTIGAIKTIFENIHAKGKKRPAENVLRHVTGNFKAINTAEYKLSSFLSA
jgi:hypothetical protein